MDFTFSLNPLCLLSHAKTYPSRLQTSLLSHATHARNLTLPIARRLHRQSHVTSQRLASPTMTSLCLSLSAFDDLSLPLISDLFHRRCSLSPFSTPSQREYRSSLPTTAFSLSSANGGLATKAVGIDPAVAVKKKAIEISRELRGTSIFLVGINSAMKTTLGKLLADVLRYYYFDSDNLVEEAAGGDSAGKSLRERDNEGFCELETEVLKQLSSMGRLVVCAGNGAVRSATNLALLRHGLSIWIDIPLDMVARDVVENGSQLSASEIFSSGSYSEVFTQLTVLYAEMRDGYATADATVSLHKVASQLGYDDLDEITKEDMAFEVLKEIEKLTKVKKMMEEAARPF